MPSLIWKLSKIGIITTALGIPEMLKQVAQSAGERGLWGYRKDSCLLLKSRLCFLRQPQSKLFPSDKQSSVQVNPSSLKTLRFCSMRSNRATLPTTFYICVTLPIVLWGEHSWFYYLFLQLWAPANLTRFSYSGRAFFQIHIRYILSLSFTGIEFAKC